MHCWLSTQQNNFSYFQINHKDSSILSLNILLISSKVYTVWSCVHNFWYLLNPNCGPGPLVNTSHLSFHTILNKITLDHGCCHFHLWMWKRRHRDIEFTWPRLCTVVESRLDSQNSYSLATMSPCHTCLIFAKTNLLHIYNLLCTLLWALAQNDWNTEKQEEDDAPLTCWWAAAPWFLTTSTSGCPCNAARKSLNMRSRP